MNSSILPPDFGSSYFKLEKRVAERMRSAGIQDRIFETVQAAFEEALMADDILLARIEKKRLLVRVLKSVLEDMGNQLK